MWRESNSIINVINNNNYLWEFFSKSGNYVSSNSNYLWLLNENIWVGGVEGDLIVMVYLLVTWYDFFFLHDVIFYVMLEIEMDLGL